MKNRASSSHEVVAKATLQTSRRSFLAGSRLALGAGLAIGLGIMARSAPARAGGNNPGRGGKSCCFLPGTKIATPNGAVEIQHLAVGDDVLTFEGDTKRVKWVGRQQFERASDPGASPVKISRHAIDGHAPHADLYVSPEHAIYIDGILIPARNLVNGITIVADAKPEIKTITYYHIELDTHEVILAEGLAVESFLGGNRAAFDNVDEYIRLYGSPGEALTPFAPIVSYYGGRQELASHIRSVAAPLWDRRKPIDKVRDRLADHAHLARAA